MQRNAKPNPIKTKSEDTDVWVAVTVVVPINTINRIIYKLKL